MLKPNQPDTPERAVSGAEATTGYVQVIAEPKPQGLDWGDELGPLPVAAGLLAHEDGSGFVSCYTADQMRAFGRQERASERERWATAARLAVEATPGQLPLALDSLRDVLDA